MMASNRVDAATLASFTRNRNKLMRLAEGIKSRKKSSKKKVHDFTYDPAYTNIEHLVFGRNDRHRINSTAVCSNQVISFCEVPSNNPSKVKSLCKSRYKISPSSRGCGCPDKTFHVTPTDGATCTKPTSDRHLEQTVSDADTRESGTGALVFLPSSHNTRKLHIQTSADRFPLRNRPCTVHDEDLTVSILPPSATGLPTDEQHVNGPSFEFRNNHAVLCSGSLSDCGHMGPCSVERNDSTEENTVLQVRNINSNTIRVVSSEVVKFDIKSASEVSCFSTKCSLQENNKTLSRDINNFLCNQEEVELCYSSPPVSESVNISCNVENCAENDVDSYFATDKEQYIPASVSYNKQFLNCKPQSKIISQGDESAEIVTRKLNIQSIPFSSRVVSSQNLYSSCDDEYSKGSYTENARYSGAPRFLVQENKADDSFSPTLFDGHNVGIKESVRSVGGQVNNLKTFVSKESHVECIIIQNHFDADTSDYEELNKNKTQFQHLTQEESTSNFEKTNSYSNENGRVGIENITCKITVKSRECKHLKNSDIQGNRKFDKNSRSEMDTLSSSDKINTSCDSQSSKISVYPRVTENSSGDLVEAKRNEKLITVPQVVTSPKISYRTIPYDHPDSFRAKSSVSVTSHEFLKNEENHQDVILKHNCDADTESDKHADNLIVSKDLNNSCEHVSRILNKRDEWIDVDDSFTEHRVKEEQRPRDDLKESTPDQVSTNSRLDVSIKGEIDTNPYGIECESHNENINSVTPDGTAQDASVRTFSERKVVDEHWKELYKDKLFQSNVSLSQTEVEKIGLASRSKNSNDFESGTIHPLNLLVSPPAEACDSMSANLPNREIKTDIQKSRQRSKDKDWKSVRTSLSIHDENITLEFKPIMCSNTITSSYSNSKESPSVVNGGLELTFLFL
ncbi:uncharacterized protein LOC143256896 [Tachypleus tridentatus]|uniref:uncharacterized protein LOC143256896 n=1 Tax=Tachypleus tridentatus TaxID=6853 RepID=UPI003FD2FF96